MKRQERLLHEDWSRYDLTHCVFRPRNMSPDELEQGFAWLSERVFSWPAIIRRCLSRAAHPRVLGHRGLTFSGRVGATLAPNMIYRSLSTIGRGEKLPCHGPLPAAPQGASAPPLRAA